jgi:hypothetical protein
MASTNSDSDAGVWQGYVSSLACLLLSLLLLMTILGLAVYNAYLIPREADMPLSAQTRPQALPEPSDRVKFKWPALDGQRPGWVIEFPDGGFTIPAIQQASLGRDIVSGQQGDVGSRWVLWAYVAGESSGERTLAYMQVLAVRNLMLARGVAPPSIDMRLLSTPAATQSPLGGRVLVARAPVIAKPGAN